MKDYARTSFWLETSGDDLTPRPGLSGSITADVAILGAGYSGLWTAYYLLRREPGLKVVVVEKEIAGFGASGRNGAWCTSEFPSSPHTLAKRYGRETARATVHAMQETVTEVGRVARDEGLDIDFAHDGCLLIARGPHQRPAIDSGYAGLKELDLHHGVRLLDAEAARSMLNVTGLTGAMFLPNTATIHPGRLVRGLARVVERLGGTIYEQTPVVDVQTGGRPALVASRGTVFAKTVVLCGEAYLSQLAMTARQVLPVYSLITLTEPLSEADWAEIGWRERFCVASCRYQVDYLSKTADGRILFGGRGAPYRYGSAIKDEMDHHGPTHRMLQDNVREWFPRLKDVRFTHTWGGPLGWPRDFMPTVSLDRRTGVASARGFTGNGVSTTNLAGRILADLITERRSPITELPLVNHRSRNWEPEPLRYLGVRLVQREYARLDAKAEQTGIAPSGRSLAERLTAH